MLHGQKEETLREFKLSAFCFVFVNSYYFWRIVLPFFAERFPLRDCVLLKTIIISETGECGSPGRTSHTSWADMCCCHHLLQARIDTIQMIIK
jgi:hypothetical protein